MKYLQMNFEIATFLDIESSFINRWMLFQKSEAESAFAGTDSLPCPLLPEFPPYVML